MNPPLLNLQDLTLDEAILFAYRYHLIDDCQADGKQVRLILGNQNVVVSQEDLPAFLDDLLRRYERAIQLEGEAASAQTSSGGNRG